MENYNYVDRMFTMKKRLIVFLERIEKIKDRDNLKRFMQEFEPGKFILHLEEILACYDPEKKDSSSKDDYMALWPVYSRLREFINDVGSGKRNGPKYDIDEYKIILKELLG